MAELSVTLRAKRTRWEKMGKVPRTAPIPLSAFHSSALLRFLRLPFDWLGTRHLRTRLLRCSARRPGLGSNSEQQQRRQKLQGERPPSDLGCPSLDQAPTSPERASRHRSGPLRDSRAPGLGQPPPPPPQIVIQECTSSKPAKFYHLWIYFSFVLISMRTALQGVDGTCVDYWHL
ncbi:Hypothetical predicted protein [Podarcis lilfordi]|uniref:Uncharacterized protein n=1 Tax=Podarcis lilfordi TaxID=74358 RepID=A0AA35NW56_9SAUR|nr:Hypothetical predicted protein [Podarcis lilfordi]